MAAALKAFSLVYPGTSVTGLVFSVAAGITVFISAAWMFNVKEIRSIPAWITKKR
jgi:hypothetical protein